MTAGTRGETGRPPPAEPEDRFLDRGVRLHLELWPGDAEPFLFLHGLASNCRTWGLVAARLCAAGHPVAAVDQRGHGLSEKPAAGYDFATVAADVSRVIEALGWKRPIVVGQSWGGNVVLEFGARHPGVARGLGFVDGGFLDLRSRPGATWARVSDELRPPPLAGIRRSKIESYLRAAHPGWTGAGVEAALANFELLADGTVRPWLPLDRHMEILRALWDQPVAELFRRVTDPVLICAAESGLGEAERRAEQVEAARRGLDRATVRWFRRTDHDIHLHRPARLARLLLSELSRGIWAEGG